MVGGFANPGDVAGRFDVAAVAQTLADARLQRRGEQRFSTATRFVFHRATWICPMAIIVSFFLLTPARER